MNKLIEANMNLIRTQIRCAQRLLDREHDLDDRKILEKILVELNERLQEQGKCLEV